MLDFSKPHKLRLILLGKIDAAMEQAGEIAERITELKGPLDAYGVFYHGFPHFLFCRILLFCDSIFSGGYTDYFSKTSYKVGIIIKTGTIAGISDS